MPHPYDPLHRKLLRWYEEHGRVTLPWRNTRNPYKIYLSEIMLQQTQVKTVLERFYFPFLEQFPTLNAVANASEESVLKAWEGLGYYSRARNLYRTAQLTQGILPDQATELQKLPGIGKSTAHAVACFAFGESLPILDANVKRILYRFFAIEKCTERELWEKAYALFDPHHSYTYNQTLMDIGATLCLPKRPDCSLCPLQSACQGTTDPLRYPQKNPKKSKPIKERDIVLYQHEDHYQLQQNTARLLQGLWSFPQQEKANRETLHTPTLLGEIVHHYSHFTIKASVLISPSPYRNDAQWFTLPAIEALALSGVDKKALALLKAYLS